MSVKHPVSYTLAMTALLVGCAAPVPPKPPVDTTPKLRPPVQQTRASFDCSGALPDVHRHICADDDLALLDRQLVAAHHRSAQNLDAVGALLLTANHRQWLQSRAQRCPLAAGQAEDPQGVACLSALYRQRLRAQNEWAARTVPAGAGQNAWASYVEYRLVDDRDPGSCTALERELERDLQQHGLPSPARLSGARMLAGSHADTAASTLDGRRVAVELYNPGVFAGYQTRARGLTVDGQPLLDDATLAFWVAEQPNYGGRAHAASSQTGDYAAIDVFERDGRTLVLVNETWGFYSPAARGESAYAGLYALNGNSLQRLCLYQSYLTPPRTNTLQGLAVYSQLQGELDTLVGHPQGGLAQHERRDNFQSWKETQWTLLNLPLLGVDGITRHGREGAVRQRHDQVLEQLFQWTERSLENKQLYRRLLPLLQPAVQELEGFYAGQGLSKAEATVAAELLVHETLARAVESLAVADQQVALPLPPGASWTPGYAIAPVPGELERGRQFSTLYSVLLNNAPAHVVADFIRYEKDTQGAGWGQGPDATPATLAAVMRPDNLRLVLDAGMPADRANRWGMTALMGAAQQNQLDSLQLLLQRGANVHSRTQINTQAGVGGPEQAQARQGNQTALLLAARHAEAPLIDALVQAGALRQAWAGYSGEVCSAVQGNTLISDRERETLKTSLCGTYAPLPVAERQKIDLRSGDTLLLSVEGVEYREPTLLFGRVLQSNASRLERQMRAMAVRVGTAAAHRARLQLAGPLTLHIADMAAQSPSSTTLYVSYPVARNSAYQGGYNLVEHPQVSVLSTTFDSARHDPASTWQALYQAALEQGLTPGNQGYVLMHTRGARVSEYQLVVTE